MISSHLLTMSVFISPLRFSRKIRAVKLVGKIPERFKALESENYHSFMLPLESSENWTKSISSFIAAKV